MLERDLLKALKAAERFISGFEGDPMQEGIDAMLTEMRRIIPAAEVQFKPPSIQERRTCEHCGSENVVYDAWARWDIDRSEWVLDDYFDDAFCKDCDGPTTITCEEITDGPA